MGISIKGKGIPMDENKMAILAVLIIAVVAMLAIPEKAGEIALAATSGLIGFVTRGAMTRKEDSKPEEPAA